MKDDFFIDNDETVFIQRKSKPKPVPMFKVSSKFTLGQQSVTKLNRCKRDSEAEDSGLFMRP